MTKRDPLIALRIPPALDTRLRADVEARGTTITDVVRSLIEERYPGQPRPAKQPARRSPAARARSAGPAALCEHRTRAGAWCAKCGTIVA